MAEQKKDMASWKPGSEADEARDVKSPGDFGVPAGPGATRQRQYVSENTKKSDRGSAVPASSENSDAARESGAGSGSSGPGSGSGGDIDTDFIGVAGGSGLSQSDPFQPGERIREAATDGSSDEFASGPHARGEQPRNKPRAGGPVQGTTTSGDLDMQTGPASEGADAATNPQARGDDSFAGEVSSGEASGDDSPISPSSDDQG